MDLITNLPKTKRQGLDAIVVFVDRFSKLAHFEATTTTVSAQELSIIFIRSVFRHHGLPESIVSDRDPRFTGTFWRCLFTTFGTSLKFSTAFHPQTDGQTERTNRTLEQVLRAYVSVVQDDWDAHLIFAEFAYNNAASASTTASPFFIAYGQHPRVPTTLQIAQQEPDTESPTNLRPFLDRMDSLLRATADQLLMAQNRQAQYANMHRSEESFSVGDEVLLSTQNLKMSNFGPSRKLQPKFIGPYPISEVVSRVAYRLDLPTTFKIHPVFHVSLLRRSVANDEGLFPSRAPPPPPPVVLADGSEEFEVEEILSKRRYRRQQQYLVKWLGYSDPTWEPAANLTNCPEKLQEFEARQGLQAPADAL
eukprot:GILJ01026305.1.p1 GENE.GILJ01026305.1~~GILJ01026305.1.p1  ORF type:complete len:364 (+),score=28.35 GILJ01026305.1:3-1094(+)